MRAPADETEGTVFEAQGFELDLDEVFRRYARYVGSIGLRILGRHHEVDDLVQDVFLQAQTGLRQLQDPGSIKNWLAIVTIRTARRRLRERRLRCFLGLDEIPDYDEVPDPRASLQIRYLLAAVYRALDTVSANQRLAWTLRYIQGESLASVAMLCGCSLATAKRRIASAQLKIQEALSHEG